MIILQKLLKEIEPSANHPVEKIHMGVYYTAVKTIKMGMAFTYRSCFKVPHLCPQVRKSSKLHTLSAAELAEYILSDNTLEATIGLATINSLLPEVTGPECRRCNLIPFLFDFCRNRRVAMVGYFPFAEKIRAVAGEFFVTDHNNQADEAAVSEQEIQEKIRNTEIRIITGTTLINHSFSTIMQYCRNGFNILFGPSVPPAALLLDAGINLLATVRVRDEAAVLNSIFQPAQVPQMRGLESICICREKDILQKIPEGDFIEFIRKSNPEFQV
jgi:uncharacterized protein (DUF4213/DUF364 family)